MDEQPTKSEHHLSQELVNQVLTNTSTPDDWVPATETDGDIAETDYPARNPRSGGIKLMTWVNEDADEPLLCTVWRSPESEDVPYTIEFLVDYGLYHGHTADSLDAAMEAASAMMYMHNHHLAHIDRNPDDDSPTHEITKHSSYVERQPVEPAERGVPPFFEPAGAADMEELGDSASVYYTCTCGEDFHTASDAWDHLVSDGTDTTRDETRWIELDDVQDRRDHGYHATVKGWRNRQTHAEVLIFDPQQTGLSDTTDKEWAVQYPGAKENTRFFDAQNDAIAFATDWMSENPAPTNAY